MSRSFRVKYQYRWICAATLGKFEPGQGLADLIKRTCRYAGIVADRLKAEGFEILNDVVLNQVLVSFGGAETTQRVIRAIQEDGTCWCGGTVWQGQTAMRISIASWATNDDDLERSLSAIARIANSETIKN